uniref:Uncharacterized protein n=1 Tax=Octopus bimaculoides TaxID=37653 RepID=A0A0L8HR26_OCTBM
MKLLLERKMPKEVSIQNPIEINTRMSPNKKIEWTHKVNQISIHREQTEDSSNNNGWGPLFKNKAHFVDLHVC